MTRHALGLALVAALGCGGGSTQPPFGDLHPVKGVVKRNGQPVAGGSVRFTPDPDPGQFVVTATVGPDGMFTLATIRATDQSGEQKPGAAAGSYKVLFIPGAGSQAAGGYVEPVELPAPVAVKAGPNDLTVEVGKK